MREMAQRVESLTANPDPSSTPLTHTVEGENPLPLGGLLTPTLMPTRIPLHGQIHKQSPCFILLSSTFQVFSDIL